MEYTNGIDLFGTKVKDRNSGFIGIITWFATYITELDQFLVTRDVSNWEQFESIRFNPLRLEKVD